MELLNISGPIIQLRFVERDGKKLLQAGREAIVHDLNNKPLRSEIHWEDVPLVALSEQEKS